MFLPVSRRPALVCRLRAALHPGGAVIVVDKCVPPGGYEATVLRRLVWAGKLGAGVSGAEIVAKALSLAGVQRPIQAAELGPGAIKVFRFGDFAGWVIPA